MGGPRKAEMPLKNVSSPDEEDTILHWSPFCNNIILTESVIEFVCPKDIGDDAGGDGGEGSDGEPHHGGHGEEHGVGVVTEGEQHGEQDTWDKWEWSRSS